MMFQAPVPDEPDSHWTDCVATSLSGGWFSRSDLDMIPNQVLTPPRRSPGETRPASRLLIVDDDEWIRDVLETLLIQYNYHVCAVENAEDAILLLRSEPFDLVLTDMLMVGMDGLALTRYIAQTYVFLPTVLITGCSGMEQMREALNEGASDFITKPFDINAIPLIIERNLERARIKRAEAEARARDERAKAEASMQKATQAIVNSLIKAVESKEPYTAQHSHRVAHISLCIAEELHLTEPECRHVALAALVHDVGKIGTPDHILKKPDKLTDEEWIAMKNHPVEGAKIVSGNSQVEGAEIISGDSELVYVADIVRHHHERWDGGGYPDGLSGNDIPLLARIIAVADSYEVMTTNRIYRAAMPRDVAIARLKEGAGRQFDTEIVEAFLRIEPEALLLS